MKRFLPLCLALSLGLASTGCSLLHRSPNRKPKESSAIAATTEAGFKQRWMEKRTAELKATGLTPEAAQAQAEQEFSVHYSYTSAAKK
jgi:1,2-phenylacetyl-CoA epoxidase catalytic subunit